MSAAVTTPNDGFSARLFASLVQDTLREAEAELVEIKSVRFLCDYPWKAGKRLRPIVFLLSNLAVRLERAAPLATDGRESRLAAAIELLHEASLVHDDLVDGSRERRGAPTMQMLNGNGLALLIGDYMVFRGLKLILDSAETRADILLAQELATTGLHIAEGEADQLDRYLHPGDGDQMSMDAYVEVIAKKTAAFFAGCAEAGAALGGAEPPLRRVFREFGLNLGLVFQMVDDIMDVAGDPELARKTLRNNLAEGTVTLPMIHAWELHPDSRPLQRLAAAERLDARSRTAVHRLIAADDVLERCQATLDHYAALAEEQAARMPLNIYRFGLLDLLEYVRRCPWGGLDDRLKAGRSG